MSAIDIRPVPGANGDIREALEIIKNSVPKDTVVLCPYIGHIFPRPGKWRKAINCGARFWQ